MAQGKKHKPTAQTRKLVFEYAKKYTQQAISRVMRLSQNTLIKYYSEELDEGRGHLEMVVTDRLMELVHEKNPTAIIYATKSMFGWRDIQSVEVANAPGEAFKTREDGKSAQRAMQTYLAMLAKPSGK
jgi:hypothetical protein